MNKNIGTIFLLILILASVFASSITDFNINSAATYTKSTIVTLNYTLTIETNCEMCFSENSDSTLCTAKSACEGSSSNFTLSSTNETKTVYAFIYDNNIKVAEINNSITLDTILPTCTISSPTITDFNTLVGIQAFDFTCTDASGIDQNYAKINGNLITDGNNLNWLVGNTTYTITVDANDLAGNDAIQATLTLKFDTTPPSLPTTPFTTSAFTNNATPTLNFSASEDTSGWKIMLSCNDSGPWKVNDYASTITNFDITENDYDCDASNFDEINIYSKFVDKAGNYSTSTYNVEIGYDNEEPFKPTNFEVNPGNKQAELNWTKPKDDSFSGNDIIEIYQNGNYKSDVSYNVTSKIISGLTNGTSYRFKIRTKDKAGNYSDWSDELTITPQTTVTTLDLIPNVSYAKSGDSIKAECNFTEDASDAELYYRYYSPNTSKEVLDSEDDVDYLEGTITISNTNHDRIIFYCEATGSAGAEKTITIDNNKPIVSWNDSNNLFSGVRQVRARASDNKYLENVEFNFNNVKYTYKRDSNGDYYFDLNTIPFENKTYSLKVTAKDGAGNTTEITRTITLDNYVNPKQLAEKAIREAKEKQLTVNDLVKHYKSQGLVIPTDLNESKTNADNLLAQAETELNSDQNKAELNAINSKKLYEEFITNSTTQIKESKVYSVNNESMIKKLQEYGLSEEKAKNEAKLISDNNIERRLTLIQTGSSNNRQIKIEVSFTNNTDSNTIKIIEVIPKELISSAKNIVSNYEFRIIQEDPIIEFTINANKGEKIIINYGIGEVDSIKAQELIDSNIMNYYTTTPIIIQGELITEEVMPNLTNNNLFLLVLIILIVALIIVGVVAIFVKFKAPGHGFGEEKTIIEHLTPEQEAQKKKFEAFKK
ncbi:MAG: fibronectin type III domain-containing protein [Bacteroidales bacterium]